MGKREMKRRMVSWIMTVCMIVTLFSGISFVTAADVSAAEQTGTDEVSAEQADMDEVSEEQTGTDELSAGQTDASGGILVQAVETEEKEFVHPGLMHTQKSIDAIRQNLADGDAVTAQAYQALCGDGYSSASRGGRPLQDVVRGGSGDNRAQMYIDIERAYQNALLWKLGAGEEHGEAAVRILNGWSHTMKTLSGTADRFLAAGIYGYQMANAAELVRDREDFDKEAMDTLLLNVFYPLNHDFLVGHNGSVISNAKETAEKEENDLAAAKETEEKIAAIGTVAYTDESLGKITEARNSYDGLSEEQKELVGNYQLLTEAEAEYARLKEEAEKDTEEPEPTPDPTPDPTPEPEPTPDPTPTPGTDEKDDNGTAQKPSDDGGTGTDNTQTPSSESPAGNGGQTAGSTDDTSDAEDALWQSSPSAETTTASVTAANTDKGDPKGSSFAALQPKAAGANRSVKLSWKKLSQADGYLVYGAACGKKMKLLADVSASVHSYQHKKLKKGTYYKYIIAAYQKKGGEKRTIATSVSVHAATAGGKYSNPAAIKPVSGRKLTLKCKKSKTLQLTVKSSGKVRVHIAKIRYESDNEKIAAVSRKGKVMAKAKGSCTVYAYTQNGFCQKIKVTVK